MRSSEDLEGFTDCTTLQGSLTLEFTHFNSKSLHNKYNQMLNKFLRNYFTETNTQDLDTAFANLREITGYLKIIRSPHIVSLHFLRNLHTIAGKYLVDNK